MTPTGSPGRSPGPASAHSAHGTCPSCWWSAGRPQGFGSPVHVHADEDEFSGVEDFFREVSAFAATVPAGGRPDPQLLGGIGARHGQRFIGPPLPPRA